MSVNSPDEPPPPSRENFEEYVKYMYKLEKDQLWGNQAICMVLLYVLCLIANVLIIKWTKIKLYLIKDKSVNKNVNLIALWLYRFILISSHA